MTGAVENQTNSVLDQYPYAAVGNKQVYVQVIEEPSGPPQGFE